MIIFEDFTEFDYSYYFARIICSALLITISWMMLTELISSMARHIKSGKNYGKNTLIYKLGKLIGKAAGKIWDVLKYKPNKFKRIVIPAIILFFVINVLLAIIAFFKEETFVIAIIILLIFDGVCAIFVLKYIKDLDKIITASTEHTNVDFGNEKLLESLRLLAEGLTNFNIELNNAVEKAVKDEQTKTELITNVSHDLKTPLTSLVSYSDLLSKCDVEDETAKKYINVINEQSTKLKRLIEDLIEASKVSTGNVTLNPTVLNLSELAVQTMVEFTSEMEKNGNEIKFYEPSTPPYIYADGSKTYRVLSNLFSNAKKYSLENTRVYVTVYSDSRYGYFEIKNISKEPLNISPDEITERFVRGEKSRTNEGNGLGLSIAKDLCALQNGQLNLSIDGDLFKAVVMLPISNVDKDAAAEEEKDTPN